MNYNEKHDIALMRYSAIAQAVNETLPDGQSLHAFFTAAAAHPYLLPNGQTKKFTPATIERWYRLYKKGGFDALVPSGRCLTPVYAPEIPFLNLPSTDSLTSSCRINI